MHSDIQLFVVTTPPITTESLTENSEVCLPADATEKLFGTLTANVVTQLKNKFPDTPVLYLGESSLYVQYIKDAGEVIYGGSSPEAESIIENYKQEHEIRPGFTALIYGNVTSLAPAQLHDFCSFAYTERDYCFFLTDNNHRITSVLHNFQTPGSIFVSSDIYTVLSKLPYTIADMKEFACGRVIYNTEDFRFLYNFLSDRANQHFCEKVYYDALTDLFIDYKELLK